VWLRRGGGSVTAIAGEAVWRFGVSVSAAISLGAAVAGRRSRAARAMGYDYRSSLVEQRAAVLELVARHPDLTLQEIRGALAAGLGADEFVEFKKGLHAASRVAEATPAMQRDRKLP
jgi:hypothetical protein